MVSTVGSYRTPSGCDRPRGGISTTRHRGSFPSSPLNLRFVPSSPYPFLAPPHSQPALIRLTMSPRPSTSSFLKPSPLEECPGAPDLRTLACPVFPPFELYADDSLEIPSMSEGTSAENSLDLPSPTLESTSLVFQVLTTSLKRPLRGRPTSKTTKGCGWIDLVKQGGATPEPLLLPHLPSDNELHLFLRDLNPESSSSLVSHDSAGFEDAADDLPPPCLLNTFSSLSKRTHQASHSHSRSRSHSRNPTARDGQPLTEPEIPEDDDVFFDRNLQTSSRTPPSERMVGSIIFTALPSSDYVFLQGMKETNDQED